MFPLERVKKAPGVYLMLDLDHAPVYAGQATNLHKRLKEHFVNQRTDVLTDVLLDIYEVRCVLVWYAVEAFALPFEPEDTLNEDVRAKSHSLDILEAALLREHKPRWNRGKKPYAGSLPVLNERNADLEVSLIDPQELELRRDAKQRIETKLLHMLRAIRKVRISGGSRTVRFGLIQHAVELLQLCRKGIK